MGSNVTAVKDKTGGADRTAKGEKQVFGIRVEAALVGQPPIPVSTFNLSSLDLPTGSSV